ncbi:hypothetical protein DC74_3683 [Streptomyces noursei]|nr:hypothetical protein DC74_3683 [Streptomyces noursei]
MFHRSSTCKALADGQEYAASEGMTTHPRLPVSLKKAKAKGRKPCGFCLQGFKS